MPHVSDAEWKKQTIEQWNNDPCGAIAAKSCELGTKTFYETVDQVRFHEDQDWMHDVIPFDSFSGQRLLEIGFGMGTDLFQFARHGARVFGVDLTPRHVSITRHRFDLFEVPVALSRGDAEDLPYRDESFDGIYTFGVIHHTPNTQKTIDEIYRVLKPGGVAIIAIYHQYSAYFFLCHFLVQYVLKLGFLKRSLNDIYGEIEYRESSDARPLVKVYSRKKFKKMLGQFSDVNMNCRHLKPSHFDRLRPLVPRSLYPWLEKRYGQYLIAICRK